MGIWIELGIFVLALGFGLWQIHDVGQERKKREAAKLVAQDAEQASRPDAQDERSGQGRGGV